MRRGARSEGRTNGRDGVLQPSRCHPLSLLLLFQPSISIRFQPERTSLRLLLQMHSISEAKTLSEGERGERGREKRSEERNGKTNVSRRVDFFFFRNLREAFALLVASGQEKGGKASHLSRGEREE